MLTAREPPDMALFSLVTFGCQMNHHDSERIAELLCRSGDLPAPSRERAELIVVNTCSVRAKAEQKLRSELGRLQRLKQQRPGLVICVAGCVAQQEGERLLQQMPYVDLVIGPDNIPELPVLVAAVRDGHPPQVHTRFDLHAPRFLAALPTAAPRPPCAYVTIMKGCNERCSFCVVPRTRGPERYRPASEIIDEVNRLAQGGVREVTLLGQTVNSYHDPSASLSPAAGTEQSGWRHTSPARAQQDESEFAALLRAVVRRVPALLRLRYTAPHPRYLTGSLIRAHQDLGQLARHVHLPVQSGSDRMLKRMVRRHTVAEYVERAEKLRESVAGLTLSTDIIVGFPGETPEDLEATLQLVRQMGFVGLFGFKYSPRPHTPALKLGDDVSEAEKARRLSAVFAVADELREAHLATLVGTLQQVLVEGPEAAGTYTGRTERNEIVHFTSPADCVGQLVAVRITQAFRHSLGGQSVRTSRAPSVAGGASSAIAGGPRGLVRRRHLPVV
jgi:tRNA-2-methylthio-N6-dimethylallyladenosine synthase